MQFYQNLYDENPYFNRFFQEHFLYQGFNIQLNDLPHLKTQFNLTNKENLNLTWKYKQDNQKFVFMANNKNTNTIIKSQSQDQQQIQYQFHLINRSNRYSILLGLKYNYEKDLLTKHTFTPQIQISQNSGNNSNLDVGFKYSYLSKKDNINVRFNIFSSLLNRQNTEYQLIGNFMKPYKIQIGLQNNRIWVGFIQKAKILNTYSVALYNINNKKYDVSAYFQINSIENRLNNKLKFLIGVSTEKEILGKIDFLTKVGILGYCLKWQHVKGMSMGYNIEI
ncbi:unnamed protein product [Paramecium pentaurelia]|uniref:Uncharacterized protein n=1 Tax=Paramecium pentaurelia TaxID=43138 RepID=A0A8S1UII6_9CILI|nr:unnamed protein product [Paramecium pentaurelia]